MRTVSLLSGLGADRMVAPVQAEITQAATITPGSCTSDGRLIWDAAGFWRQLRAGEQCTVITSQAADVRTGPGGGITTTVTNTYRTMEARFKQLMTDRAGRQMLALAALAPQLPPCPASSQNKPWPSSGTDTGRPCYLGPEQAVFDDMMLPPGTFSVYDVAFHVSELADGAFQKMFVPTDEQKLLFAWEVIRTSADVLKDVNSNDPIEKVLRDNPDLVIKLDGFSFNPPEPTPNEMQTSQGYRRWIERGGFPISLKVARGQHEIQKDVPLTVCASIKCACPTAQTKMWGFWTGEYTAPFPLPASLPRCVGALVGKDGVKAGNANVADSKWDFYVAIDGVPNGQYIVKVVYRDPSWFAKMQFAFGDVGRTLAKAFCGNPGPIKDELKKTTSENCIDANQKTCTKGTPGCTCSSPSTTTKLSVNAWETFMTNVWCPGWLAQEATPEAPTEPQVPAEIVVPKPNYGLWIALGLAAVGVVGGIAYLRR